jgi:hypothetical protein
VDTPVIRELQTPCAGRYGADNPEGARPFGRQLPCARPEWQVLSAKQHLVAYSKSVSAARLVCARFHVVSRFSQQSSYLEGNSVTRREEFVYRVGLHWHSKIQRQRWSKTKYDLKRRMLVRSSHSTIECKLSL